MSIVDTALQTAVDECRIAAAAYANACVCLARMWGARITEGCFGGPRGGYMSTTTPHEFVPDGRCISCGMKPEDAAFLAMHPSASFTPPLSSYDWSLEGKRASLRVADRPPCRCEFAASGAHVGGCRGAVSA